MTVTPQDEQRLATIKHTIRLLQGQVAEARPDLAGASNEIDDALAALGDAESAIAGAQSLVLDALEERDQIESGDRDQDGNPRPYPWYRG